MPVRRRPASCPSAHILARRGEALSLSLAAKTSSEKRTTAVRFFGFSNTKGTRPRGSKRPSKKERFAVNEGVERDPT